MKTFTNFKKGRQELSTKMIWLEPEHFESAKNISNQHTSEADQWKGYLNALALLGFENWLKESNPDIKINLEKCSIFDEEIDILFFTGHSEQKSEQQNSQGFVCNIGVEEFQVSLVTIDNLIDDTVLMPNQFVKSPKHASHFYILVEVLEEQEQLKLYGLLRRDKLMKNLQAVNLEYGFKTRDALIPVSWFDTDVNNLFVYTRFLSPSALPLPVSSVETRLIQSLLLNLSDWWNGVYENNWQSSFSNNLAWGYVRSANETKPAFALGVKPIILQDKTLKVSIKETKNSEDEKNQENDVLVKIEPDDEKCLPPGLKLKVTLYPNTTESVSKEAIANDCDVAIKLEFSELPGTEFFIEASLGDDVFIQECVMSNSK